MFPIVEKLGGWTAVEALLLESGVAVSAYARKKWQAAGRERLPRNVVAALAAAASARTIKFEASDFDFHRNGAGPNDEVTLKVSAKGQVTLESELLKHLGVAPGGTITVEKLPGGKIEMRASSCNDISAFFTALKPKKGVTLSIDDINEVSARGWAGER